MKGYSTPFALPRARSLLGRAGLAFIATMFYGTIINWTLLRNQPVFMQHVAFLMIFDVFFLLLIAPLLARSWRPALLFGLLPDRPILKRYTLLVFPLIAVAVASTFLLYLPLSYVSPGFVEWWLLDQPKMISGTSVSANVLCFLHIVVFTPVFEEFVFRGLLMTRWALKWNVRRGVFLSSALFAIGHVDIIGAFFVGYVLCVLYIETKSLYVPIGIHAVNNGIAWIMEGGDMLFVGSDSQATLAEWQSYWWVGILAIAIVTPWVIVFIKRHINALSLRVPYLALQEGDQVVASRA